MKWKKFSEELPPIDKAIVISDNSVNERFSIANFGYSFSRAESNGFFPKPLSEKDVKSMSGYWLELPELPK